VQSCIQGYSDSHLGVANEVDVPDLVISSSLVIHWTDIPDSPVSLAILFCIDLRLIGTLVLPSLLFIFYMLLTICWEWLWRTLLLNMLLTGGILKGFC